MVLACYVWVREYNNIPLDIDSVKGLVHTPDHLDDKLTMAGIYRLMVNSVHNTLHHNRVMRCKPARNSHTPHTPKILGSKETNTAVDEIWTIMRRVW